MRMVLESVITLFFYELYKVRKEIELENLAKCYLHDILKKKYWDSMHVKGRAIKVKVKNRALSLFLQFLQDV